MCDVNNADLLSRIVTTPGVLSGRPRVDGTRIAVQLVLERLSVDLDVDRLLEDYPSLTREDVMACVFYASEVFAGETALVLPPWKVASVA